MNYPEIHYKGNEYYEKEEYDIALEYYESLTYGDYENKHIIFSNMAACYLQMKDYVKALEYGLKSVEINNKYYIGWIHIGSAYKGLNKLTESLISFKIGYNIEKKEIYKKHIHYLENKVNSKVSKMNIFNIILNNKDILYRLKNTNIKNEILNIKNYSDIFSNKSIIEIIDSIIEKL